MSKENELVDSLEYADLQKRTLRTLMSGLVPAGAAITSAYSAAAVLGEEITGNETLGALAAACLTIGAAISTLPLAKIMTARGRRPGIVAGYTTAALGALLAMTAAITEVYIFLPLGILGVGVGNGANLAARFAAADLAPEENKASAIGNLVWASTIGSVLGPSIGLGPAKKLGNFLGTPELAGPYIISGLLFLFAALTIRKWLRPDPLVVAGGIGFGEEKQTSIRKAFKILFTSKVGRLSVGSMVAGHVVMVGVMTMTPLHLKDGGHQLEIVGFVISLHIIGMYAFSPLVGVLTGKIGAKAVIGFGGLLLVVGSELASHAEPEDSLGVFMGLFLIGLGWSFGLVASSALIAGEFDGPEKVRIQGLADLSMTASGGLAGLGSGLVVTVTDYQTLSHYSGILGLYPTITVLLFFFTEKKRQNSS
ncbi:MAG: MFS transporter [Acidimicrobiales bacterium]|nr:MFS transporter [Acidimicrobiales bacterium]